MTDPTITAEQRDALYEQVLVHLSGIGDVWIAISGENFVMAERLGQEFTDDLQLLRDLGWGGGPSTGEPITLSSPADVLQRAFSRIRDHVTSRDADEEAERLEAEKLKAQSRLVVTACDEVLSLLPMGDPT